MKKLLAALLLAFPLCPAAAVTFEELSFEEKLGQTLVAFVDVDSAEQLRPAIETGKIGGVLIQWGNYSLAQTEELIVKLQRWAANSPHKIPLFISIDYEGGTVYTPITLGFDYLPTNMMLSAAADEEGAAAIAYLAGLELRRAGVHINFSPVLDVNNNPDNPIIGVRSFGADPADVTKMGLALINGFKAAGVMSIVKHFPGHGDTAQDSHYAVPVVKASAEQMQKVHLAPFAAAVKQGVSGVMTGHVLYPALDAKNIATFSKPILQDLLKTRMGFKGLIVTDSLDMKSATAYCTIAGCAVRSLENGADMVLLGRYIKPLTIFNKTLQEVKEKKLQPRVEEAAEKIFEAKRQMGLLDGSWNAPAPAHEAYRAELEKISSKAVTLVRNRKKTVPFIPASGNQKPTVCAVFFAPARFSDQLMNFSKPFLEKGWNVRSYNAALTPRKKDSQRAAACAKGADLLILTSLQWADKTNINQKNAINGLIKENKNTVFISTMSPYDIKNYPEADTVLATYGLNRYVLQTAADIILGNQQAQGKLPVELPKI
ncbi:MAG: glycoside hydrolase family 3 N-terminal domain-containing protein [Candidatus Avelusimicrobium sp.]|uniref:glycoside hydrolase family 3 protein n=1 Tax=Candidatus Avelusimicrobium sp. TaxID=3048833 RepID=UPI003F0ABA8F